METIDPPADEPQEWVFTFGSGQYLYAGRDGRGYGEGIPLMGRFVRISGTFQAARAEMYRLFGNCWSSQYDQAKGAQLIAKYGLTEVTW